MNPTLVDILACPKCRSAQPFELTAEDEIEGDVVESFLTCSGCGAVYSIRGADPRFVATDDDYCGNFGFQWQTWKETQVDRLGGHHVSENRFFPTPAGTHRG